MSNNLMLKICHGQELNFFSSEGKDYFTIGSDSMIDDIYIDSEILDGRHLLFKQKGNKWYVVNKSQNEFISVGRAKKFRKNFQKQVKADKEIEIYSKDSRESITISPVKNIKQHKDFLYKSSVAGKANSIIDLSTKNEFIIGRDSKCDIIVDNPQVDHFNTKITYDGRDYYVEDLKSSNGTCVNNEFVKFKRLTNYDFINIPTAIYMFLNGKLVYTASQNGINISVDAITKTVKDMYTKKPLKLIDDVSFNINAGDFVCIVGGSGAGKSTILDAINGRRPATDGRIYYDLNDYYSNLLTYQSVIGYVPQQDIMHESLTVAKTLYYYAAIRMRHKLTKEELQTLCNKAMSDVSLLEKANVKVSALSGGQKKRVSIAMELLSDPKIIFLDEPTSGLSPDLDYELMNLLYDLSKKQGRTIVVITHAMDNVDKCDKLAFLGNGGRLCYYDAPSKIFSYFNKKKFAEIFSLLSDKENAKHYADIYKKSNSYSDTRELFDKLYRNDDDDKSKTKIKDKNKVKEEVALTTEKE